MAEACEIKPVGGRIVLEPLKEEKTESGIILADTAQEKSQHGTVLAVSDKEWTENGAKVRTQLIVGDRVVYAKYAGSDVTLKDGREVIIMRESDILGVLD